MSRPMLLFDRLFSAANGRLCSLRGTLLVAAVLLVTAGETIAQSTSVLEWSFGTTTIPSGATLTCVATSGATVTGTGATVQATDSGTAGNVGNGDDDDNDGV
jgi:hypothetical protein